MTLYYLGLYLGLYLALPCSALLFLVLCLMKEFASERLYIVIYTLSFINNTYTHTAFLRMSRIKECRIV